MKLHPTLSRLVATASLCALATLGAVPAQAQNDTKPMAKGEAASAAKASPKAAASKPTRAERQAARKKRNAEMKDAVKKGDVTPVKP